MSQYPKTSRAFVFLKENRETPKKLAALAVPDNAVVDVQLLKNLNIK